MRGNSKWVDLYDKSTSDGRIRQALASTDGKDIFKYIMRQANY